MRRVGNPPKPPSPDRSQPGLSLRRRFAGTGLLLACLCGWAAGPAAAREGAAHDAAPGAARHGAAAQGLPAQSVAADFRLGFDGTVVLDAWVPLVVSLHAPSDLDGTLEVLLRARRPASLHRVRVAVRAPAGQPARVAVPVILRDRREPVVVRLLDRDGRERAAWRLPLDRVRVAPTVVLALSARPAGLEPLLPPDLRAAVAYLEEEDLPDRWHLYEGVHAVVVRDLEAARLSPAQVEALQAWVATGGRLLVAAPPGADGPARSPVLAPLFPVHARSGEWRGEYGRGHVALIRSDPFAPRPDPLTVAAWQGALATAPTPPLVDRRLLDLVPSAPDLPAGWRLAVLLALGAYVAMVGPLLRMVRRGPAGMVASAAAVTAWLLLGWAGGSMVRGIVRAPVQALVVEGLPPPVGGGGGPGGGAGAGGRGAGTGGPGDVATAERVRLTAVMRAPAGAPATFPLPDDALGEAVDAPESTLDLAGQRLTVPDGGRPALVWLSAVRALPLAGVFRPTLEGAEVLVRRPPGVELRDAMIAQGGQVRPVRLAGDRAAITADGWRDIPDVESATGAEERLRAWLLRRLERDAIITPTASLVAWLHDRSGALGWAEAAGPRLLVLPLIPARRGGP